jgi:hypothetical protein
VKRLLVVPIVVMFLMTAFIPASSAAEAQVVFLGQGQSNALQLSLPLLNILPGVSSLLGGLAKGLTVGHTESTFEGLNPAQANGLAIGVCSLLGSNLLNLPAVGGTLPGTLPSLGALPVLGSLPCTGQDQVESASAGNQGSTTQQCGTNLSLAILEIQTACADSMSTVAGGRPVSQNDAGVASITVSLLPNILGTAGLGSLLNSLGLGNLLGSGATNTSTSGLLGGLTSNLPIVGNLVNGLLGPVLQNTLGGTLTSGQSSDLLGSVTQLLQNVLGGATSLLSLSLGQGSTVLSNNGSASTEVSQAAGATVGLLGNLIQVTVGAANATVNWNDATGQASSSASPAIATVKVGNLLDPTGAPLLNLPINLPDLSGLLGGLLETQDQAGDITLLGGTPLQTEIKVASATPAATGSNVTANSTGVGIDALEGLGASSASAFDGGLRLNLANASASMAGSIAKVQSAAPALPITGGPTYVFLAGAAVVGVAAAHLLRSSRKLRAKANA